MVDERPRSLSGRTERDAIEREAPAHRQRHVGIDLDVSRWRTASTGGSTACAPGTSIWSRVLGQPRRRARWPCAGGCAGAPRRRARCRDRRRARVRTCRPSTRRRVRRRRARLPGHLEAIDLDGARRPLDLLASPGELVEAPAAHLDRRDHGRHLLDRAGELAAAVRTSATVTDPMSHSPVVTPEASSVSVDRPSTTSPEYVLARTVDEPEQARGPPEADEQHTRRVGVEGSACPTRRCPTIRRTRATASCEVQPGSLSTTTSPDESRGRSAALASVAGQPGSSGVWLFLAPASARRRRTASTRAPSETAGSAEKASRGVRFMRTWLPTRCWRWARRSASAASTSSSSEPRNTVVWRRSRRGGHGGDRHHPQPLVGVGESLELLGDDLAEHLVDTRAQRGRGRHRRLTAPACRVPTRISRPFRLRSAGSRAPRRSR